MIKDAFWEYAARTYCQRMGINPDAVVGSNRNTTMSYFTNPQWQNVANELKDHYEKDFAIKVMHEVMLREGVVNPADASTKEAQ